MLLKFIPLKYSIFAFIFELMDLFEKVLWILCKRSVLDHKLELIGWKHGYKSHHFTTSVPYVFMSAPFSDLAIVLLFPAEQK